MSTNDPGQPEYLGSERAAGTPTEPARRSGRRTGVLVASVVGVVAAVGAGTYGVVSLMAGGTAPASAVPATAIGYVSLDLDPSAGQKIEAVKMLHKFPAWRSQLHVGSRDDLRRAVFEQVQKDGACRSLDYAQDIEPWIGERVALAAVPGSGHRVLPLVALQVSDRDAAEAGVRKLVACAGEDTLGVATSGDYLLLTERQRDADAMAASAGSAALADDAEFGAWTDRTGDPGIVTMYVAEGATDAISQTFAAESGLSLDASGSKDAEHVQAALKDFSGAAGVLRFHDGAVEAELAAGGIATGAGAADGGRGPDVGTLPATTGAVLSVALRDGWLDPALDDLRSTLGAAAVDSTLRDAEQATGLDLPGDLETLLGRGVSVAVDSSLDPRSLDSLPDPATIPAGIRITGDPARITAVIDKLEKAAGPSADVVHVATSGDTVAVGTDKAYVEELVGAGSLGSSESFRTVVPGSGRANGVFFLDFDAGDGWAEQVAELVAGDDPSVRANVAPLDALGITSWQDGDKVQHALVRLTID